MVRIAARLGAVAAVLMLADALVRWAMAREPREAILNRETLPECSYIILGDSAFCSHFVRNETETLWAQLEKRLGAKVFPGALDAVGVGDLQDQAEYVAAVGRAGSTVILDVLAHRNYGDNHRSYRTQFDLLLKRRKFPLPDSLFLDVHVRMLDPMHLRAWQRAKQILEGRSLSGFRRWDADGDFALNRYRAFLGHLEARGRDSPGDYSWLETFDATLRKKGMKAVYVIAPVNLDLMDRWPWPSAEKNEARRTYERWLKELAEFLERRGMDHVDLSRSVGSAGFADVFHANAEGDAIMAERIAGHILETRGKRP